MAGKTNMQSNSTKLNVAVHYHPDGYDTGRAKLMGRHAAGEEFLKALAHHGSNDTLYAYAEKSEHFTDFVQRIRRLGHVSKDCQWISWDKWPMLSQPGCLFYPGPGLGAHAWQRRNVDERSYSLCGITHTTASHAVMDSLADLLVAPVQPWDALICTSQSVKNMVTCVLEEQSNYLRDRFGLSKKPKLPLALPVIPLGVDCDRFAKTPGFRSAARQKWRQLLTVKPEDVVVLFVGRLSFHAKAHPMPLYRSLEATAKATGKTIHLVMAGWFANDAIKNSFVQAARMYCPSVKVTFIDGRKPEVRDSIWYAADIFSSLSDNIQETFGLTPLEAMAAGLPVVISDWDGYRETADQKSGFLIPTYMASPGSGSEIALAHASGYMNYDNYIGFASQLVSVDIKASTEAFTALVVNPELRQEMGVAAQRKARMLDWPVIVARYELLWQELAELRKTAKSYDKRDAATSAYPARQDPTILFQSYPSDTLGLDTLVSTTALSNMAAFEHTCRSSMNTFASSKLFTSDTIRQIFFILEVEGPILFSTLASKLSSANNKSIDHAVLWMSKMGLLQLSKSGSAPDD